MSNMIGVVRHCVMSSFGLSVTDGLYHPQASSGCAPFHSTSTPCGAASSGRARVPTLRNTSGLPQIEFTMMSGSPSPFQSATERHVYAHLPSAGPWMEPLYPAMMRIGSYETIPPSEGAPREGSKGLHERSFGSDHFGGSPPGPLRFSIKPMYPAEFPVMMSKSPSPSQSTPAGVTSIPKCTLSASPRR